MTIRTKLKAALTRRRLSPRLAFMHVPKAAGTSIIRQIDAELRPRRMIHFADRTQYGGFDQFATLEKWVRHGTALTPEEIPGDADVLVGHLGLSTILARYPEARLATVLREPRCRQISHWLYWRGYGPETRALYGAWGENIALSQHDLADYLERPEIACITDNCVTRMLLWPHPLIPDAGFIAPQHDATLLAEARAALARFTHVDIAEADLSTRFGTWLRQSYGRTIWTRLSEALSDDSASRKNEAGAIDLGQDTVRRQVEAAEHSLSARSRIDFNLWADRATTILSPADPHHLAADSLARTIARYDGLRSGHAASSIGL